MAKKTIKLIEKCYCQLVTIRATSVIDAEAVDKCLDRAEKWLYKRGRIHKKGEVTAFAEASAADFKGAVSKLVSRLEEDEKTPAPEDPLPGPSVPLPPPKSITLPTYSYSGTDNDIEVVEVDEEPGMYFVRERSKPTLTEPSKPYPARLIYRVSERGTDYQAHTLWSNLIPQDEWPHWTSHMGGRGHRVYMATAVCKALNPAPEVEYKLEATGTKEGLANLCADIAEIAGGKAGVVSQVEAATGAWGVESTPGVPPNNPEADPAIPPRKKLRPRKFYPEYLEDAVKREQGKMKEGEG